MARILSAGHVRSPLRRTKIILMEDERPTPPLGRSETQLLLLRSEINVPFFMGRSARKSEEGNFNLPLLLCSCRAAEWLPCLPSL